MGTSTSFRAPRTPRWQAFTAALQAGSSLERIRSELFNAGSEWENALAMPAIAELAVSFVAAGETLPTQLFDAARPEWALQAYATEARESGVRESGFSPALPLAERALRSVLTRSAGGSTGLSDQSIASLVSHLESALASPTQAATDFLGELLVQYTRHVVSRETGRLTEGVRPTKVSSAQETTQRLASLARELASSVTWPLEDAAGVRGAWEQAVRQAFRDGRKLPSEKQ